MAVNTTWNWPFSRADLNAGMRRLLDDRSVQIVGVHPATLPWRQPSIGIVRALKVEYVGLSGPGERLLVVKEPQGSTRAGLAGAGRREIGVYRWLARQVPLRTPRLIGAADGGSWLLLETLENTTRATDWHADHYHEAIDGLAALHDRFWGLGDVLETYAWLGRPLEADFKIHLAAARKAIRSLDAASLSSPLTGSASRRELLATLTRAAHQVAAPLRSEPATLLHGDYWPGNIAIQPDGSQVVYDWQMAAVGPGILDLAIFLTKSEWSFDQLPLSGEAIIRRYRERMLQQSRLGWDDERWAMLWDHALMWAFFQEWLDLLAATPGPLLMARAAQLDRIWLDPVAAAVARRLDGA